MNINKKYINIRTLLGILFLLAGIFGILEKIHLISNASGFFWGFVFGIAGIGFFYNYLSNRDHWWSFISSFSFFGLAGSIFLPAWLDIYRGFSFLGMVGIGFLAIYLSNRKLWWTLIPSGVIITLGGISIVSNFLDGQETGALFFIGLGITFILVRILPNGTQRMNWAFIPAAILLIIGTLLGSSLSSYLDYIWITILFMGGLIMIWRYLKTTHHI